jgi:hypothetical protein
MTTLTRVTIVIRSVFGPSATEPAEGNSMIPRDTETLSGQRHDKQLQGITLDSVIEKRRLDQALNAKEFAVCAGVSYSTARGWFHLPGFPVFRGVIFWQDFVHWRTHHNGVANQPESAPQPNSVHIANNLPPRAARILLDAR